MAFELEIPIRFRDVDALGHVNNAVYLSYCEVARLAYFREHVGVKHATDFDFILARAEVDFQAPLGLEAGVVVAELTVPKIGNTSWDFEYQMRSADAKTVYARARTVQVYYNYSAGSKESIPEKLRAQLERDRSGSRQ